METSIKAFRHEKVVLKRFSEAERIKLFQKWGVALTSKRRRLQLANLLWSDVKDMNNIKESTTIIAKLVRFVEQGHTLKEMFGLSFTPPQTRIRSFGWKSSLTSHL